MKIQIYLSLFRCYHVCLKESEKFEIVKPKGEVLVRMALHYLYYDSFVTEKCMMWRDQLHIDNNNNKIDYKIWYSQSDLWLQVYLIGRYNKYLQSDFWLANAISNFETRISNFELRISNFEFRVLNFEFRISNFESRISNEPSGLS